MKMDLKRLEQIGRRFSKMGTSSDFERLNLSERVERVVEYLNKRLPSIGKRVNIIKILNKDFYKSQWLPFGMGNGKYYS